MGERRVTVCDHCYRASCWHGEFMCDMADVAGTVEITSTRLDGLGLEHPDSYSAEKLRRVCGDTPGRSD